MGVERICVHCKKQFIARQVDKINPALFCSRKCHYDHIRIPNEKRICIECNKEFILDGYRATDKKRGKFCSSDCQKKYQIKNGNTTKICKECGKEFTRKNSQLKASPYNFCSYKCSKGKNNPNWKIDRAKLSMYIRSKAIWNRQKYGSWCRFSKLYKDKCNLTCILTGFHSQNYKDFESHHIVAVNVNPELCFEESNIILLKKSVHRHFHKLYGNKVTEKEWNEYLVKHYPDKAIKEIANNVILFNKECNKINLLPAMGG